MWQSLIGWANQASGWTLLVLLVVTGRLIPRSWHRERIADYQRTIAAREAEVAEQKQQIAILLGRVTEPGS